MGHALIVTIENDPTIQKLKSEAARYGIKPHHLAHDLLNGCRKNDDLEGMRLWRNIWIELMSEEYRLSSPIKASVVFIPAECSVL
jgi:hypothetical protein